MLKIQIKTIKRSKLKEVKNFAYKDMFFTTLLPGLAGFSYRVHYYSQYDESEYPPCWMIAEILPLGAWSKLYEHLAISKDRKLIARQLDLPPALFRIESTKSTVITPIVITS